MSELELISNDAVYSSQKQLSVDLKDNGIWGTKTADNEPEITFKRLFHAVFYILWDVVSTHNASVATSSKAEFLFSRYLGVTPWKSTSNPEKVGSWAEHYRSLHNTHASQNLQMWQNRSQT